MGKRRKEELALADVMRKLRKAERAFASKPESGGQPDDGLVLVASAAAAFLWLLLPWILLPRILLPWILLLLLAYGEMIG